MKIKASAGRDGCLTKGVRKLELTAETESQRKFLMNLQRAIVEPDGAIYFELPDLDYSEDPSYAENLRRFADRVQRSFK